MNNKIKISEYISPLKYFIIYLLIIGIFSRIILFGIPWIYYLIFSKYVYSFDKNILIMIIFSIIAFIFLNLFFYFINQLIGNIFINKLLSSILFRVFEKILRSKYDFFKKNPNLSILSALKADAANVSYIYLLFLFSIINIINIFLVFIVIYNLDLFVFRIYLIIIILFLSWDILFRIIILKLDKKAEYLKNEKFNFFNNFLINIKEIKYFNLNNRINQKLKMINHDYKKKNINLSLASSLSSIGSILPIQIATILIFSTAFFKIVSKDYSVGFILIFFVFSFLVMFPVEQLLTAVFFIIKNLKSLERIKKILTNAEDGQDGNVLSEIKRKIEFINVTLNTDKTKLQNLKLNFPISNIITILCEDISVKNTILDIIFKFNEIIEGHVKFDDKDLNTLNADSIRSKLGIISNDIIIFDDTLRNNIDINKSLEEKEIYNICNQVGLLNLIKKLPDGLNTLFETKGKNILTGEEKIKLFIARNLAKNINILILDDVISHLDNKSEKSITNIFLQLKKNIKNILILNFTNHINHMFFLHSSDIIYEFKNGIFKRTN